MKTKRKDENGVSDPFVSAVMSIALHALMDEDDEDDEIEYVGVGIGAEFDFRHVMDLLSEKR